MKSKKVLLVASSGVWSPTGVGGSDSYMRRLSIGLAENGYEVTYLFSSSGLRGAYILLLNLIRSRREYLIIVYRLNPMHRIIAALGLLNHSESLVIIPFAPVKYARLTLFSYVFISSKIAVVSHNLRLMVDKYTRRTAQVLLPATPSEFINKSIKNLNEAKVIFVGRVDERKGFDKVLELFTRKELESIEKEMYLIYHDDDPGVKSLLDIARESGIKITEIDRREYSVELDGSLCDWFDSASYFVQPYRSISSTVDTPLLLLEATSRGVSILTTNLTQTNLIVDNSGRFALEEFVERSIEKILSDDKVPSIRKVLWSEKEMASRCLDIIFS